MNHNDQTKSRPRRLVFFSKLALYPIHWEAFKYICTHYRVEGIVITDTPPDIPNVHQQLGWVNPDTLKEADFKPDIHYMPPGNRLRKLNWLRRQFRLIKPDVVWVQEEPTDPYLLAILGFNFFNRKPKIITAVCENIFTPGKLPIRLVRRLLWPRLDGLLATAGPSIKGVQAVGMPVTVPAYTLVAGALNPPETADPLPLPFDKQPQDFVVGFVGRVCEEKGWKILLAALCELPASFKCVLVGDGPQVAELGNWLTQPPLQGRVFHLGLLPKADLWRFYAALDCLVLPSLTFPTWKEQFGGVLADGMAMGLPLIGSDSGSIPEVIGPAGLVVPEGQSNALASALQQLHTDIQLRTELSFTGRQRFLAEYAIPAYARKIAESLKLVKS